MYSDRISWTERLDRLIWRTPADNLPRWKVRGFRVVRVMYVLARDLSSGELTLRAMSLVYTTLLALVPVLALSFSVLKAFGVHNQLEPVLAAFLAPLGERGAEVTQRIMGFIQNVNVGVLGAIGLALLVYTVVSLMRKIEESFNFIWHVSQTRAFGERFSRYFSVLLVGPLLVFSALGITAAVLNTAWVSEVLEWQAGEHIVGFAGNVMPYVLVVSAFTFIYTFIPNTRVRLLPAFAGGLVGGVLWQSAGWAFAMFVASSTSYAAIYSGFALIILFMIWLYLSWLIVLFGASVAFYCQYPQYLLPLGGEPRLSNRMRERLALAVAAHVAQAYAEGAPALTQQDFVQRLGVPGHGVAVVLNALVEGRLLVRSDGERYLPARDLNSVSVHELLAMVRSAGEGRYITPASVPVPATVQEVLERQDEQSERMLGNMSVASLWAPAPAGGDATRGEPPALPHDPAPGA